MKFIDTFTEDDKKKLIKRAKLIYSVLKKGTITRSDGVKFSYELGDNMVPSIVEGEPYLFAFITKITERTYCPINEIAMSDLIMKKFEQFDIKVDLQIPKSLEIVKYEGKKPWELNEPLNEDIDIDKERNRVKTVHKAIRKGIVNVSGTRFRYELPEEYTFHVVDDVLTQTSIKFTFYNQDITGDKGGLNLPLKVWRIQDGKDEYLNDILSAYDVADITYNDEYNINTKSGVDYANVKNKVRNKYRNFDINCIMTTPSDSINESEEDGIEDKGIIKAKQVFRGLRKGIFRFSDRKNDFFRYVLPENYEVYRDELGELCIKVIGDMDMFSVVKFDNDTDMEWPTEKEHKGLYEWVEEKITKKFEQFDIKIIFVKPEPINENYDERRQKMIKKGKTVFKALRKGVISDEGPDGLRFSYELSNDFTVDVNNLGIVIFTDGVKIKELNRACDRYSTGYMVSRIRNKFYQFDIVLTYPHVTSDDVERWEEPEEPINEDIEDIGGGITEKELKKVKTVYKAIKKGFFKYDNHATYGYELPEDCYAYRDELGNVCIKMTDQEVKYISKVRIGSIHMLLPVQPHHDGLRGWIKERIINKFEGFNIKFIF